MNRQSLFRPRALVGAAIAATALLGISGCTASSSTGSDNDKVLIGLITKTDSNPYFVAMSKAAKAAAAKYDNVEVQTFAGDSQTDAQSQVDAVETLVSRGAAAIMIVAIDPESIASSLKRAKAAGTAVIALDTPLTPASLADATIATDNFAAGEKIGEWAKAKLTADGSYDDAKVAMLDLSSNKVSVDVLRDQGFMTGFGFNVKDKNVIGDETDSRIVGHEVTDGNEEGGRRAMEVLLQRDPTINLVYAMSEVPARGAYQAIKAAGLEKDITIVAIDGECAAVPQVKSGIFGADSMQFPSRMASLGVKTVVDHVRNSTAYPASVDSGVGLYSTTSYPGVKSKTIDWAKANCWG
jgi:fructose transport system substrate-binding protein